VALLGAVCHWPDNDRCYSIEVSGMNFDRHSMYESLELPFSMYFLLIGSSLLARQFFAVPSSLHLADLS
jgi:hypothetical protein